MVFRNLIGIHPGKDIFVVGTGTSLKGFDFSRIAGKITIALNNAIFHFRPTYHIFSDEDLIHRYKGHKYSPKTLIVCQEGAAQRMTGKWKRRMPRHVIFKRVNTMKRVHDRDHALYVNRTVATGAIILAWKMAARRIFLLGIDGYRYEKRYYLDGSQHTRPRAIVKKFDDGRMIEERHRAWTRDMEETKAFLKTKKFKMEEFPGPGVFNLNPESMIKAWEKIDFESATSYFQRES